ncbi:MAG: phosphopentomutase, partial [candidate division Zixibacteria bacterium]|nr:phosphopentomutase [candidate division Zixibacteria bacterium]
MLLVYIPFMIPSRVILIVIDACGVGELPDAARYGDRGAATIPNVATAVGGLRMPACQALGLGNIIDINGVPPAYPCTACYGKMAERAVGKDSISGHWEMGGVTLTEALPVFPHGFPEKLVCEFENRANVKTIGNVAASGTDIIKQHGQRHLETGELILYTSADSVFQLAAHEQRCPPDRLYDICQVARDLLQGEYAV